MISCHDIFVFLVYQVLVGGNSVSFRHAESVIRSVIAPLLGSGGRDHKSHFRISIGEGNVLAWDLQKRVLQPTRHSFRIWFGRRRNQPRDGFYRYGPCASYSVLAEET